MDNILHLSPLQPYMQNTEILEGYPLTQSEMDGLHTLLTWCEGFVAGKSGTIPGAFDSLMFYRSLAEHVRDQQIRKQREKEIT